MLNRLKPEGIPFLVTAFGALVTVVGTMLGLRALIDPSTAIRFVDGAEMMAGSWAGRNLGIGLLTGAALLMRNARAYVLGFLACTCREIGDIAGALHAGDTAMVPVLSGFLVADLLCLGLSVRAFMRR